MKKLMMVVSICSFMVVSMMWATRESSLSAEEAVIENPESLATTIDQIDKQKKLLAEALIKIASSTQNTPAQRKQACLLLGKVGNHKAIQFLLENIELKISIGILTREEARAKSYCCVYALKSAGWKIIPQVVEYLQKDRSDRQLLYLSRVVRRVCGKNNGVALFSEESKHSLNESLKKNISKLIKSLNQ